MEKPIHLYSATNVPKLFKHIKTSYIWPAPFNTNQSASLFEQSCDYALQEEILFNLVLAWTIFHNRSMFISSISPSQCDLH